MPPSHRTGRKPPERRGVGAGPPESRSAEARLSSGSPPDGTGACRARDPNARCCRRRPSGVQRSRTEAHDDRRCRVDGRNGRAGTTHARMLVDLDHRRNDWTPPSRLPRSRPTNPRLVRATHPGPTDRTHGSLCALTPREPGLPGAHVTADQQFGRRAACATCSARPRAVRRSGWTRPPLNGLRQRLP